MALSLSIPAAAMAVDGCCPQSDCCRRQKRFDVCCVTKEVCRLKLVCVTDECGRTCRSLQRVPTTVTRKRLVRVDRGCGCDSGCQSSCGCGNVDVPVYGEPVLAEPPVAAPGE